jgi:hypothetical protein
MVQGVVYGASSQELPPQQFDRFARICSASGAGGGCIALLCGAFLFSIGGYFLPYFVLSGSLIILAFIIHVSGALDNEIKCANYDVELMSMQAESDKLILEPKTLDFNFIFKISVSTN